MATIIPVPLQPPDPQPPLTEVVEEVHEVATQVEAQSERSEERHSQLLEGETWLRNQTQLLLTNQQSLQEAITNLSERLTTETAKSREQMEARLLELQNLLPVIPLGIPPTPEAISLEPESNAVAVLPVAEIEAPEPEPLPPPKRRRRLI